MIERCPGQVDDEGRAATQLAFDADPAAMQLHELLDDSQSEAEPPARIRVHIVAFAALEPIEDGFKPPWGNSLARIMDRQPHEWRTIARPVQRLGLEIDPSTARGVPDCVGDEV